MPFARLSWHPQAKINTRFFGGSRGRLVQWQCRISSKNVLASITAQVGWLDLRAGGHPVLSLHSSDEPGELLQ